VSRRAAIYARISKDREGAGLGVERQREHCHELAQRLGWTVVAVHTDNDLSAYSGKPRPGYKALLNDIRVGRVDAVIAWHDDRLHRSPAELEQYIATCEPRSVPTHFVQAGPLDLSTASGRMTARITGAVARAEVEHMSERIRNQKRQAAKDGKWIGGARPFGYTHNGMHLIPEEAAVIRDGVCRVLSGETTYSIAALWRTTGVRAPRGGEWIPTNVVKVLTRPRNAGYTVHRGEVIGKGTFPAIISEDEHEAVCAILNDPKRTTYVGVRTQKWLGVGLYRCGKCGADMRSAVASTRNRPRPQIYRCRAAPHLTIHAIAVDDYVTELVCQRLDREGPALFPAVADDQREHVAQLRSEAAALRVRYEQLDDMFSDGEITRAGRTKQRERINAKLAEIDNQLGGNIATTPLAGVADAETPSDVFIAQPVARQRAIVNVLMTVTILPGRPRHRISEPGVDLDRIQIYWRTGS
jgi:site-specific DNA recombinase